MKSFSDDSVDKSEVQKLQVHPSEHQYLWTADTEDKGDLIESGTAQNSP